MPLFVHHFFIVSVYAYFVGNWGTPAPAQAKQRHYPALVVVRSEACYYRGDKAYNK
ncbi:MAG TPA: hypothetical protein VKQ36_00545 [Ktedonobacterales bacterium]|nr:hypothetical protein [Ktedonobacterales bacterium]